MISLHQNLRKSLWLMVIANAGYSNADMPRRKNTCASVIILTLMFQARGGGGEDTDVEVKLKAGECLHVTYLYQ